MKCILPESRVRLPAERSRGMCSAAFNEMEDTGRGGGKRSGKLQ